MLLARAEALARDVGVEGWLQRLWKPAGEQTFPVRLPFWMDAVLAASHQPEDVGWEIAGWRARAERFRAHRIRLEDEFQRGHEVGVREAQRAVQGAALELSASARVVGTLAAEGADVVAQMVPGGMVATQAGKKLVAASQRPLWQLWQRLRRPELWIVHRIGNQARQGRRSLEVAARVFGLPAEMALDRPAAFLERLAEAAWVS
jgi:hypothetical protein